MLALWWTLKFLPWWRKNWKWVLLPIGIISFILGFLLTSRRKQQVVAPKLLKALEVETQATINAEAKVHEAEETRDEQIKKIEEEHKETVESLTDEQKGKLEELKGDPEKLNAFLLNVGKSVRDG